MPRPMPTARAGHASLRPDADGMVVRCGQGALRLTELQRAGGKRLPAADFLRGFDVKPGMVFEPPSPR